jgi:hypothetical protein
VIATLVQLGRDDQRGRADLARAAAAQDTATLARSMSADSARTVWLRRTVGTYGWPVRRTVGAEAADAAWLIVQHSPMADWQAGMLPTLERLAARGELPRADVALLTDRVLVHRGEPQRYGSQFDMVDGRLVAARTADLAGLDRRRAAIGLPPMAVYVRTLREMYGLPVVWPPKR